ncbi:MAG: pantetheine-phosphate adenylyltransferase [Clostridiales bacterium]|nr:pantetheine-phosphate adenylyltransferase [Clostridiales bacterium]
MRLAVYAGAFDPITNGHLDVLERAAGMFDRVVMGVAEDANKKMLFSVEERVSLIREVVSHLPNVSVEPFGGLLVDFCRRRHAQAVIRGLRAVSDFDLELQMALMNRQMSGGVDTVFFMASAPYLFTSSSLIKNIAGLGGEIGSFVHPKVAEALERKYAAQKKA